VTLAHVVTEGDTALAVESGDVPVLATPRLIAWLEAATVEVAKASLESGRQTSVGIAVRAEHRQRPSHRRRRDHRSEH
jgi:predicted thioesterase